MDAQTQPISEPTRQQSQEQPKEQIKKTALMPKINWALILLIIGIVCLITSFSLTSITHKTENPTLTQAPRQTTNPTVHWKTYKDSHYGGLFLIKYPPDWTVKIDQYVSLESPDLKDNLGQGTRIVIDVEETDKNDIEEWFANYKQESEKRSGVKFFEDSIKRLQVDHVPAIQFGNALEIGTTNTEFIKNNKHYIISMIWSNEQEKNEKIKIYDQILSAFTFTK